MFPLLPLGKLYLSSITSSLTYYRGNGLVIHYTTNNQIIEKGEMLLIDAGCEYK